MIPIWTAIISGAFDLIKHRSERKRIERKGELDIKQAKTKAQIVRINKGDDSAVNMDMLSAQNRGWKDEYLLFIVTLPLILSFFPQMVPFVTKGFDALKNVPHWYMWLLAGVYIDTFGFRRILRVGLENLIEKKFR